MVTWVCFFGGADISILLCSELWNFLTSMGEVDMAASSKIERPLEIVFRPGQAVGLVHLRNPRNPAPEIEYLRKALPGVDVRVDPKVDTLLLKLPESACEQWRSIDLADLKRMGLLQPIVDGRFRAITWQNDRGGLDVLGIIPRAKGIQFVKRDDEGKLAGLFVSYTYTSTKFLGYRRWFACPGCRRPARILYGVNSLRCRRCRGLKYASQSEASHWRAQRKVLSIRRRVGASGGTLDGPFPPKPRKMRWATYIRLRAADAELQKQWVLGAAGDVGRLRSSVKRR
jgi:hypothetical protein